MVPRKNININSCFPQPLPPASVEEQERSPTRTPEQQHGNTTHVAGVSSLISSPAAAHRRAIQAAERYLADKQT